MTKNRDELVPISRELVHVLKTITDEYDKEDRSERDQRKSLWTKLENYFNGLHNIYWDAVAKDWRVLDSTPTSQRHYDKIINTYRAHGESIIAALSIKTPSAIFYPHDADVEEDIVTAKACDKLKRDIESFNAAKLLIIKILMILYNQGVVSCYIYNKKSSKFGVYVKPKYGEDKTIFTIQSNCPDCGSNIKEDIFEKELGKVAEEPIKCPVCGYMGLPIQETFEEVVPTIIGSSAENKSKTCIEVFSPLFSYIPFYARRQEHMPYHRLRFETHYSALKNLYPFLKKKGFNAGVDTRDAEDRAISVGTNSSNLCTVECWWLRDWALDILDNRDTDIKLLKEKYPDGIYLVYVDDQLVDIANENLDDHWIISQNPLSHYLHADPIGKPLAPIQELQNEVVDLQIETFEHSIPETHARADVVDFKKYGKERARPGMMYPVNAPADGTPLSGSFHTIKTATLSEEHAAFLSFLKNEGQFVVHSFPSIFGGPATSGSKTAREYIESRSMALQVLGLTWNMVKDTWARVMSVAVPLQIRALKHMGEDYNMVEKTDTGFINNWIKQTDLLGTLGRIEADVDEEMPLSPYQLKGLLTELIALKDENISAALYHPQNTPMLKKALGAPDFYIPGSDDRNKQFAEFVDLLNGVPVPVRPTDNHMVEAEACVSFMNSPTGLMIKKHNPEGYDMLEMHWMEHESAKAQIASPGPVNPEEEELDVEE
jgi:hypothetical protein